jgi:Ni/Co efflux regulator RcnB
MDKVRKRNISESSESDKLNHHLLSGAAVYFIYKYSFFLEAQCQCPEVKQWEAMVDEVRRQSLNTGPREQNWIYTYNDACQHISL